MKNIKILISTLAVISIMFSFTGCVNSDVKNVMTLIDNIGEVSVDSKNAIDIAQNEYNKLSEEDKQSVKNIDELENAQRDFEKLLPEYIESFCEKYKKASYEKVNFNEDEVKQFVADYYDNLTDEQIEIIGCAIVRAKAEEYVVEKVKESMKNPSSFELVSFDLGYIMKNDTKGTYGSTVKMTYRGTNSFGGVVPDSINGMVDFNVDIKTCAISLESSLFM